MKAKIFLMLLGALVALTACGARRQTLSAMTPTQRAAHTVTPDVPAEYQKLYTYLKTILDAADAKLDDELQGRQRPITFAAELIIADSNRGTDLLKPETLPATRLYLDRLYALGVRGVKISVQYPLFTPSFPNYDRYVEFFRQVASEVKQRNMKLTVQASVIFAGTGFTDLQFDFATLTFDKFKNENRQMAQAIINNLHPDYLVIVGEPDTAAKLTGLKELNDPAQSVEFVRFVLQDLDRGTTKIAAGTGTWSPLAFAQGYARNTNLDCIVLHMYPVGKETFANAYAMANLAKQNAKCVLINEMWLYKTLEMGGGNNVAASEEVFKRDAYSFWQPLDQEFLRVMTKLADRLDAEFISPFWSMYFFGYLDYEPRYEKMPYNQLRQQANQTATKNLLLGSLSPTGEYYKELIATHK